MHSLSKKVHSLSKKVHSLSLFVGKSALFVGKSALFVEKVHSLTKSALFVALFFGKSALFVEKSALFVEKVHSLFEKVHSLSKKCTLCQKSALFVVKKVQKSALFVEKVHSLSKKVHSLSKKCTLWQKVHSLWKIALFLGKAYNFLEIQDNFYIITCMWLRSYLSYQLSTRLHLDPIFDLQVFRNKKLSWEGARLATNVATGGSKGAAPPRRKSGTPRENGENLRYGWRLVDHWLAELNLNLPSHWLSSYYWWLVASILEVVTISVGNFLHWIEPWCWLVSSSISKLKKLPLLVVSSSIWKWKKLPLLLVSSSVWNLVLHKGSYHLDW